MNIRSWALPLLFGLHLHLCCTELQLVPELTVSDMPVTESNQLKVTGIPKLNASRFNINIGHGEESIALHFDVRFDYTYDTGRDHNLLVFNMKKNSNYTTTTEVKDADFPFEQGEEFKVIITFTKDEFLVKIPGNIIKSYPNNFGDDKFMFVKVRGDVRIKSFSID